MVCAVCHLHSVVAIDSDELWESVKQKIRESFANSLKTDQDFEKCLQNVKDCIKRRDHLTVFHVTAGVDASDVDITLLRALLKGKGHGWSDF